MVDEQRESGTGKKSGNGWIVLILAALIIPGAVYFGFRQTGSPVKLPSSLPAPSKPAQSRDAQGHILPPPSFDAVNVDENGMLFAAGKGPAEWNILLQNAAQTLGGTKATSDGEWLLTLERPLDPGDYVLSLLAQDPSGQPSIAGKRTFALTVAPRAKTVVSASRQAAPSSAAAEVQQTSKPGAANMTKVKRGDSLWSLAQQHLGSGNRYPEIFSANKSQIKNPNLIYPEQQFKVPH
jgi:nucleoid-associated protein YgaU